LANEIIIRKNMLIGHEKILERLRFEASSGKLHHAQLFLGPQHVGKTKTALTLTLEMQGAAENPILKKQLLEGADADTMIFLDDGETLPISKIREVIARISQTHSRPYLVTVIENIGRMKIESMNALLKTLEEPPPGVIFFLTANKEEDIIPTIRSRCQITHFHTVNDNLLRQFCGGNVYEELLIMFAMGRPGKLRRLLDDTEYFEAHRDMYERVNLFLEKPDTHKAFALVREYEKNELLQEMLDILLGRVRTFALSGKKPDSLAHLDLARALERIEETKEDLVGNVNARLSLENLLLPFAP
jgi:DNA polymerase-3 subunit delta'